MSVPALPDPITPWEYRDLAIPLGEVADALRREGAAGWEIVAASPITCQETKRDVAGPVLVTKWWVLLRRQVVEWPA